MIIFIHQASGRLDMQQYNNNLTNCKIRTNWQICKVKKHKVSIIIRQYEVISLFKWRIIIKEGVARWLSGRASDLRSKGRGFEPRPWHCCATTFGKLVHTPLPHSRDTPRGGLWITYQIKSKSHLLIKYYTLIYVNTAGCCWHWIISYT